jgi:hypothetical protein
MVDCAACSTALLTCADRTGLLVIADIPLLKTMAAQPPRPDISSMLEACGNHPSIIAWSWTGEIPSADDLALLRRLDPHRILLVRGPHGSLVFSPADMVGQPLSDFDALSYTQQQPWLDALQQAENGTQSLLVSGTLPGDGDTRDLGDRQREMARLCQERLTVESVRRARCALGYFVRPPRGETLTGLTTRDGTLTPLYLAAWSYNKPCSLALRMRKQGEQYHADLILFNDDALPVLNLTLFQVLTPPDGLTVMQQVGEQLISLSGERRQDLSAMLPAITLGDAGSYQVQYILNNDGKVFALSQVITFSSDTVH